MSNLELEEISNVMKNTSLGETGVTFQGKGLKLNEEEQWGKVVEAIEKCDKLDFLNLEGNSLGVDASKAIAKALESKPELKVALWKDIFTGRLKEEIPKALLNLGSGLTLAGARLTVLDMCDNAFGPIGTKGLVGLLSSPTCYQLQQLKLNNNGLGTSGAKMLSNALLQCHESSAKEGKPLQLKVFIAGRNRLENEGATAIAKVFQTLGSLEEIILPQNGIYSPGIKALSESFMHNKSLRVIDLNDNTITKKGAQSLAKALPHLQKLQIFNVQDCLLKTGGAEVLADALKEKHLELEELHMSSNEIRCSGGTAIVEAMKNKSKLKLLTLNSNNFGEEGCQTLKNIMTDNNRISSLGSLSEDEGESDDEDEHSEEVGGSENENENEDDDITDITNSKSNSHQFENDEPTSLSSHMQNISLNDKENNSLNKFLHCPTIENFTKIDKKMISDSVQKAQIMSPENYLETLIPIIIKVSSLSSSQNDDIKKMSFDMSLDLYKNLFSWAAKKKQISLVNNILPVYLGIIKSEDKKFSINWDTSACLEVLNSARSKGFVPESTEQIIVCCKSKGKNN